MARPDTPCCGHDHVGADELWLTDGEVADVVFDAVDAANAVILDEMHGIRAELYAALGKPAPPRPTKAERRKAMRAEFDERRATHDAAAADEADRNRPKSRAELRDERARRRWGVD